MNIKTVLATLMLAVSAVSFAYQAEGRYRQEIRNPIRGENYTLIRTLDLNADGTARLTTEYRGDRPTVDLLVRDDYGSIMERVSSSRIVYHSGTWRQNGNRVSLNLDRMMWSRDTRNIRSTFEFDRNRDELIALRQDTGNYGDRMMRLRLSERFRPGNEPDPRRIRGTYGWGEDVKAQEGDSIYFRQLRLNEDGSAELTSEYAGARPRTDRSLLDLYGSLFAQVVANRRITHRGKWRESDGRIYVDLDRLSSGSFPQNIRSSFRLDPRGNELIVLESDRQDYGSRDFRLRRDWTPRSVSGPISGARPPVFQSNNTIEYDKSANGGGFLNREGAVARELHQARLILRKNGDFELRVRGQSEWIIRGKYDMENDTTIKLEGYEAEGLRGFLSGQATLNRSKELRKISLRGEIRGGRTSVTFDAR